MRILFLAPQPFFLPRGTCFATERMLRVLGGEGHRIDLLTYPGGDDPGLPNVRVLRVPAPPGVGRAPIGPSRTKALLDVVLAGALVDRLYRASYDVIHAVEEAAYVARVIAPRFSVPYVYDMDSRIVDQLRYTGFVTNAALLRLAAAVERRVIRGALAVTVIGSAHDEYVRSIDGHALVRRIEDTSTHRVSGPPAAEPTLRRRLGWQERPYLLYTGNFQPYQGIPLLLEAFRKVREARPDARLALVGGEERERRRLESRLSAADREAVALVGKMSPAEAAAELGGADLLVSPRLAGDNPPLKLYEYLFSGVPIVATAITSHTQVVDESTAFLAATDADSLAAVVLRALADREERARRAAKARALGVERYSPEAQAEKIRALYREIEARIGAPPVS